MRRLLQLVLAFALTPCGAIARAEAVYDFVAQCEAASQGACFARIRAELDQLRAREDHRAFCLPLVWGGFVPSTTYPVSVLEYMRVRLAASRIGRAGDPAEIVLRDVLAEMFPCRRADSKD